VKTVIFGILAIVTAAWGLDLIATQPVQDGAVLWLMRQQGLYLTGLLSIALMSLSMLLATRPVWLEKPLGGLDRIYRLHKWSGIVAIGSAAGHWLIEQSDDLIKTIIGTASRPPKIRYDGLLEILREFGKDMGEPAFYLILAMLAITLWRRFPYHLWRHLHRIMPVLYLMLAVHAIALSPVAYWTQPVGVLLAALLIVGVTSSVIVLTGLIGHRRQVRSTIVSVRNEQDVTEITCRLDGPWQSHRPGQFAFVTFNSFEGAHPFTIASADRGDQTITFCIKSLGDFTRRLGQHVAVGQEATVEGPYGRFQLNRRKPGRRQIWVAGGIGITPFLAWLESLQGEASGVHRADLHYCTRDRDTDPFVSRLQALCAPLPGITLHVHSAQHGEKLTVPALGLTDDRRTQAEVWFCGPRGLADALRKGMKESWNGRLRFHQEAFEMR
jgi:predicted ferric reductase